MGWNRYRSTDVRPNGFMTIPFIIISVLGLTVFFDAGDWPLGVLFSGLTAAYVAEFFASFGIGARPAGAGREPVNLGEKGLGAAHVLTGLWLMYLTFATVLNVASGLTLPT
jgi:uncharacterized membrane protein